MMTAFSKHGGYGAVSVIKHCFILVLVLTSCSSPESDGKNAAKDFCENIDSYVKNKTHTYQNFITLE